MTHDHTQDMELVLKHGGFLKLGRVMYTIYIFEHTEDGITQNLSIQGYYGQDEGGSLKSLFENNGLPVIDARGTTFDQANKTITLPRIKAVDTYYSDGTQDAYSLQSYKKEVISRGYDFIKFSNFKKEYLK